MEHNNRCDDCGEPIIRPYPEANLITGLCYFCSTKEVTIRLAELEQQTKLHNKAQPKPDPTDPGVEDTTEPSMVEDDTAAGDQSPASQTQPVGIRFEYKVVRFFSPGTKGWIPVEQTLNELGDEGWKLQAVDENRMYLFRPKRG